MVNPSDLLLLLNKRRESSRIRIETSKYSLETSRTSPNKRRESSRIRIETSQECIFQRYIVLIKEENPVE